jgi:hypothetical protein
MATTQNTSLSSIIKPGESQKLTVSQQKSWANAIVGRMLQSLKASSVNNVLWGDQSKK